MLNRAYSLIELKSVDEEQRILEGVASTPTPDRVGDVIVPTGAKFALPIPLLWQHRTDSPIGRVLSAAVTEQGIRIKAQIEKGLLPEIDKAWALIKSGLVRGLSIGFKDLESEPLDPKDPFWGGQKFLKWEWLELSAVTIPANSEATISSIKSIDAADIATVRGAVPSSPTTSHRADTHTQKRVGRSMKKTISEQKQALLAEKEAKEAAMVALMPEDGTTLDDPQQEEFDNYDRQIKAIDRHLVNLETLEQINRQKAVAVQAGNPTEAAHSRSGLPVITVHDQKLPPGIGFARLAMAKAVSYMDHSPLLVAAKELFPYDARLHKFIETKGNVAAANTQSAIWAGNLTYADNLASEFVEFLRPMTIIGQFGTGNIPSLRRVPFNIRFNAQTTGGEAWWVGEGAPKPVTSFEFTADTLTWSKVANIAVITQEQARFSSPAIEGLVRDSLAAAIRERLDRDFVDPAHAAVANVNPASITNGLTALSSAGTSSANVITDIQNLLEQFILDNIDVSSLVLIMPNTLAMTIGLMLSTNSIPIFPNIGIRGGNLLGIPVITSQYAANLSGSGNMVIAVSAQDIMLADDGQVDVSMSTEASLEMKSDPTVNSRTATATSLVSMWQTNSIALKAERFINWKKRRTGAVVYMDDVNWGSVGSPT